MIETIFLWLFLSHPVWSGYLHASSKNGSQQFIWAVYSRLNVPSSSFESSRFCLCFFADTVGFSKIRNSILLLNAIYHVIRLNCVPSLFDVTTTFASGSTGRLRRAIRVAGTSGQRSSVYGGVVSSSDDSPNKTSTSVFKFQAKKTFIGFAEGQQICVLFTFSTFVFIRRGFLALCGRVGGGPDYVILLVRIGFDPCHFFIIPAFLIFLCTWMRTYGGSRM